MIANLCNSKLDLPIGGTKSYLLRRKAGYRTFEDLHTCQLVHIGDHVYIEYTNKSWLPSKVSQVLAICVSDDSTRSRM